MDPPLLLKRGMKVQSSLGARWGWVAGLLVAGLSSFSSELSWAVTAEELGATWATGSGAVRSQDWREMLTLFAEDAETQSLLQDIERRLGASSLEDIARIVSLCPDLPGSVDGRFSHQTQTFSASRTPSGAPNFGAGAASARARALDVREEHGETQERLRLATVTGVCMRPGRSLLDSFGVMVHELTHFRGWRGLEEDEDDVLNYRNRSDFALREVEAPGGEVEAYTAQGRALCRLEQRTGVRSNDSLMRYFNSDCELSDRAGLITNILDRRGYRRNFEQQFDAWVAREKAEARSQIEYHRGELRSLTARNLGAMQNNVGVYRNNIGVYERRGDLAGVSRARAQLAEAERSAAFYEDYLSRIDAEAERLERRLETLNARFP